MVFDTLLLLLLLLGVIGVAVRLQQHGDYTPHVRRVTHASASAGMVGAITIFVMLFIVILNMLAILFGARLGMPQDHRRALLATFE